VKPSRFGSVEALYAGYDYCEAKGIEMYGGGQIELGVGRGQIQILASLFHPDGVNDIAPSGYDWIEFRRDLEPSPLDPKPEPTGMGIWRTFVSRPADVERSELYYGGPVYIAGYTPTGENSMYAFLVEKAEDRFGTSDEDATRIMLEESRAYDGPWNSIRADLEAGAHANYTWFTKHIVDAPWNRGRAVIIGDAAHSCPPTIAQGAAQGLEDALVLTELLVARDAVDQELWDQFHARRLPRASAVVEASVQLGQWQIDGNRDADAPGLIFGIAHKMAEPA